MKHNTIICMHTAKICIIWKKYIEWTWW